MNYKEAERLIFFNEHLALESFYVFAGNNQPMIEYKILKPFIIAPELQVEKVFGKMLNSGDNEAVLKGLGFLDMDLRVFIPYLSTNLKMEFVDLQKTIDNRAAANQN